MNISFFKYQGTGNDFVMIDNRAKTFPKEKTDIFSQICDRHFGIGADGIILIEDDENYDFEMIYYNADGSQTFCGNGARCAVAFAKTLNMIEDKTNFIAVDGEHFASIKDSIVSLQMIDVNDIKVNENSVFAYTGTQHHVELVDNLDDYPVFNEGRKIRYSYENPGSNVNFVQQIDNQTFRVRTYEKGVEDETLACGTGVTAVAIAMHKINRTKSNIISLPVEGGNLEVTFTEEKGIYKNVFLKGPAKFVFEGSINI
ncbi:diaminopimelate epimerase [Polaribacter porphyrae]|uniref:Diaminopimelate epimerase n=1 Tax=Polaribacter porphyrae TaxID=1137780 RepID=A0A2S7WMW3_9FLAO|nr:diaminopimelate epimerase [Polaribacter porphyrae]PQJ78786.1 diaminopimelate epimerase [Polaribacter porphyrae]